MVEVFFRSILIGYSGAMMPGSLLTYTIDKSLKNGAKSGIIIAIGHAILELFLVILLLLGLGRYLGTDLAKTIIGIAGGGLLGYFGLGMVNDAYRNRISISFDESLSSKYGNLLAGGAVISASNPYFIFWWAIIGLGLIMNAYNTFGITGVIVFYIGHIMADISWYGFVSILISKTRTFFNLKVYKIIIVVLGICLVGFGASFVFSGLKYIFRL